MTTRMRIGIVLRFAVEVAAIGVLVWFWANDIPWSYVRALIDRLT